MRWGLRTWRTRPWQALKSPRNADGWRHASACRIDARDAESSAQLVHVPDSGKVCWCGPNWQGHPPTCEHEDPLSGLGGSETGGIHNAVLDLHNACPHLRRGDGATHSPAVEGALHSHLIAHLPHCENQQPKVQAVAPRCETNYFLKNDDGGLQSADDLENLKQARAGRLFPGSLLMVVRCRSAGF